MTPFADLFDSCAYLVLENQFRLDALLGEHQWRVDKEKGVATFSPANLKCAVQFIGTHSTRTNSWLWADANTRSKLPARTLALCRRVRDIGRARHLPQFYEDHFRISDHVGEATPDTLAMVATHLGGADAYYRGPYRNGAVYFAFSNHRIRAKPDFDLLSFQEAFNSLIWIPGNTRNQVLAYAKAKGLNQRTSSRDAVQFTLSSGEDIRVAFKNQSDGAIQISIVPARGRKASP
jgi:hypothetical protein